MLHELAKDVFTEVGNRLQKRRLEDFVLNFGSHLTDQYKAHDDPAFYDKQLRKRLEENQIESKSKLDEVINKYASKQFAEEESTSENEEDEDEDKDDDSQDNGLVSDQDIDIDTNDDLEEEEEDFGEEDKEMEGNGTETANQGNEASKECDSLDSSLKKKHLFSSIFMPQRSGESSGMEIHDHPGVPIDGQQPVDTVTDHIKEPAKCSISDSKTSKPRRLTAFKVSPQKPPSDNADLFESQSEEAQMSSDSNNSSEQVLQSDVRSNKPSELCGSLVINNVCSLLEGEGSPADGTICDGKAGGILSGDSPAGHSSDKENIASPLIHCETLSQTDHSLALPSLNGEDLELPQALAKDDDCTEMNTMVSSTGSLTSINKRLKLSHKVHLKRSGDGVKRAGKALKAVLNKFGDALASKTKPAPTIDLLSESSDSEGGEDDKVEVSTKEVFAVNDGQLVSASNQRSCRSRKDEIKAADGHSLITFTADVHAEPHNDNSSSSAGYSEKIADNELPVEDAPGTCAENVDDVGDNVDDSVDDNVDDNDGGGRLPSQESCEQKQNEEPIDSIITTMDNMQGEDQEVSAGELLSPCSETVEKHQDDVASDGSKNSPTDSSPATSAPSQHEVEQAGCSTETGQTSVENGKTTACSPGLISPSTKPVDVKEDICLLKPKQTVDTNGESSGNAIVSVDAATNGGSDSDDDCVVITDVVMKRKHATVKSEVLGATPTATTTATTTTTNSIGDSLLKTFDLNSICSSAVSKVLQEKRTFPANVTSVPPSLANAGNSYQRVMSAVTQHATNNHQLVKTVSYASNRSGPFLLQPFNRKPSFRPVATSTPVKNQMMTKTVSKATLQMNATRQGLGTSVLNQVNSTTTGLARSHRGHVPNVGSTYGCDLSGATMVETQWKQGGKKLLIIKPCTQEQNFVAAVDTTTVNNNNNNNINNINNRLVTAARQQRRRNRAQNSDVIILSDSD